jgi:hypothetical protein
MRRARKTRSARPPVPGGARSSPDARPSGGAQSSRGARSSRRAHPDEAAIDRRIAAGEDPEIFLCLECRCWMLEPAYCLCLERALW